MNEQAVTGSNQARETAVERTAQDLRDVLSAVGRGGAGHLLTVPGGSEAILSLAGDLYVGHLARAHRALSVVRKSTSTKCARISVSSDAIESSASKWAPGQNTTIAVIGDRDIASSPFADASEDSAVNEACSCHPDGSVVAQ